MRIFSFLSLLLILLSLSLPVRAQEDTDNAPREMLPVEAALLYTKLIKIEPNYNALIASNPSIKNDPARFGNDVLMKQQYAALKNIYDSFTPNKVILLKKRVRVLAVDGEKRIVTIDGLTPDEPFLFPLNDNETYGVFLRNAKEVGTMSPPYEFDDFFSIVKDFTYAAEITVKPLVADREPFPLADGKFAKPIIGDVVEINLIKQSGNSVIKKRFTAWKPVQANSSLLDLKDNPLHQALPQ